MQNLIKLKQKIRKFTLLRNKVKYNKDRIYLFRKQRKQELTYMQNIVFHFRFFFGLALLLSDFSLSVGFLADFLFVV